METDIFVFAENFVFNSVWYNGTLETPKLFEVILDLQKVQMRGQLLIYVFNVEGTTILESGIGVLSKGGDIGGHVFLDQPCDIHLPTHVYTCLGGIIGSNACGGGLN